MKYLTGKEEKLYGENLCRPKTSLSIGALPIGLAHGIKLKNDIKENEIMKWTDVDFSSNDPAISYRKSMENDFKFLLD